MREVIGLIASVVAYAAGFLFVATIAASCHPCPCTQPTIYPDVDACIVVVMPGSDAGEDVVGK